MASKWEKVVDITALIALGLKLSICGRSVRWWDEELCQLVKDHRAFLLMVWIMIAIRVVI